MSIACCIHSWRSIALCNQVGGRDIMQIRMRLIHTDSTQSSCCVVCVVCARVCVCVCVFLWISCDAVSTALVCYI